MASLTKVNTTNIELRKVVIAAYVEYRIKIRIVSLKPLDICLMPNIEIP